MKGITLRSLVGLMVFVLVAFGAYAGSESTETEKELPEGQARVVIAVEGMTCGGCCVKVETAVKELEGIMAAVADYEKGMATFTYDEDKVTVEQIVETINTETSFKATMPEKTT